MNKEKTQEEKEILLDSILNLLTKSELTAKELQEILCNLMYSIGGSVLKIDEELTSEQVLQKYYEKPSIGSALMAQAIWMKKAWENSEGKDN